MSRNVLTVPAAFESPVGAAIAVLAVASVLIQKLAGFELGR